MSKAKPISRQAYLNTLVDHGYLEVICEDHFEDTGGGQIHESHIDTKYIDEIIDSMSDDERAEFMEDLAYNNEQPNTIFKFNKGAK